MSASSAERIGNGESATPAQMFVINLAASTSPMALSHPSSPALKRFTFFVSRQREEGRERFRLHMGYFHTQEQAEELLASVRDVYPAAWAGPAPTTGMGRRGRIAPGSVVPAAPAPVAPAAPVAPVAAPAAAATSVAPKAAAPAAKPPAPVAKPAAVQAPAAKAGNTPPLDSMSNVRDVLAQLSESPPDAPTVIAPAPALLRAAAVPPARAAKVAAPVAAPVAVQPAAPVAATELSGLDALSLLEEPPVARTAPGVPLAPPVVGRAPAVPMLPPLKNPFEGLEKEPEVRLVTPEDTQTLTDIKVDRENNAPPCFAVQLVWSATPVDVATLPHLAIFEAYTLYNVEGNRQGRKWYGLRLGFFSDPNSASQVANYVRSDYKTVAVVPVAVKERDRARGTTSSPAGNEPEKTSDVQFAREAMEGFELLTDDRPPPPRRDLDDTVRARTPAGAATAPAPVAPRLAPKVPAAAPVARSPVAAAGKPTGKRVVARRRAPDAPLDRKVSAGVGGAEVLESTLEILGASTLSLEDGRTIINDATARKPVDKKSGGNRFSRLLSRLGGG
jgi:hypothetical protein